MDDDGDALAVLGHAAFGGDVDTHVACDRPVHGVVVHLSHFVGGVAVYALNLVGCRLNMCVCECMYVPVCTSSTEVDACGNREGMFLLSTVVLHWQTL